VCQELNKVYAKLLSSNGFPLGWASLFNLVEKEIKKQQFKGHHVADHCKNQ
jgi:hypothetical protein